MIRPMAHSDVSWAARQHAGLMENSVFALFGSRFLESLYREFARSGQAVAYVYERGGAPRAVIASTTNRKAFLRSLIMRSGITLAWSAGLAFARQPPCRRLLMQSGRYLRKTGRPDTGAELIFITVAADCRGKGVARSLIIATLNEFRRRGVEKASVSIESENTLIGALLCSLGFRRAGSFAFADKDNDFLILEMEDFVEKGVQGD